VDLSHNNLFLAFVSRICMRLASFCSGVAVCHTEYVRKFDVKVQLALTADKDITVYNSLESLVQTIKRICE